MNYVVFKVTRNGRAGWRVETAKGTMICSFTDTRKEAVTMARLLAGWHGSVVIKTGRAA